jgi:hypothetical protein
MSSSPGPASQLLIDDPTGFRAVLVPGTVEIRGISPRNCQPSRAIREKHRMAVPDDDEQLRVLTAQGRVLLAI